ncbi:flagellar hook-length control protein FliK [Andreprevotia chitinilytica]|uniref:flagellar hook-length control protein FliK n=1 Tax=Andreprevotia chitinilytica TaxID=396808 RepID=UPI00054F5C3C|nr:flagellar hook-length control protein FliK [Andreprevotia chitinilytica]
MTTSAVNPNPFLATTSQSADSRQGTSKANDPGDQTGFNAALQSRVGQQNNVPQKTSTTQPADKADDKKTDGTASDGLQQQIDAWMALLQSAQLPIQLPQTTTADATNAKLDDTLQLLTGGGDGKSKKDVGAIDLGKLLSADQAQAKTEDFAVLGKSLPGGGEKSSTQDNSADDFSGQLSQQRLAQLQLSQNTNETQSAKQVVASHTVQEPVGDNRWGDAVAQRVSLMLGRQEQQLEMQLNPPHLGPMEVKLSMAADQASVIFTSQHANVREALAAATPRLTSLLADQGITLTNVQVASDSLNQQAQQQANQFQQQSDSQRNGRAGFSGWGDDGKPVAVQISHLTDIKLPVARGGLNLYV